jgi:hypothetical protein
MSGNSGGGTTTTKSEPWYGVQPGLNLLYGNAANAYSSGQLAPNINTGQTAPLSAQFSDAFNAATTGNNTAAYLTDQLARGNNTVSPGAYTLQNIAGGNDAASQALQGIANGSNPATQTLQSIINGGFVSNGAGQQLNALASGNFGANPAAAQLLKTANGDYLDPNNPAIQGLFNAQAQPITKQFQTATLPGLLSAYSAAGRYGSGANDTAIGAASDSLAQNLNNLSQQTIGQNYINERSNQQNAANTLLGASSNAGQYLGGLLSGAASSLGGLQSGAASALGSLQSGAANQLAALQGNAISALPGVLQTNLTNAGTLQDYIQGSLDKQIAQQNYIAGMPLLSLQNLSGLLGGVNIGGTTTQTGANNSSGFRNALGGALAGGSTGAAFGPWGAGIGAGIGLLGGLL